MVGDAQQLQAIEAGAAFRFRAERHGAAEIVEVRRQTTQWMRDATRDLATGRTLGTVEKAAGDRLAVRLDDGRRIAVDLKSYAHVDHGYAATVHKTQGMTVDQTHVLATPGLDAHATYVAMSRHRSGAALHYGRDEFADEQALRRTLARERPKDMALDYAEGGRDTGRPESSPSTNRSSSIERSKTPEADRPGHVLAPGELAHTERAQMLRAMVAARVNAPKPTAESVRDAIAALKAAPRQDRSYDND